MTNRCSNCGVIHNTPQARTVCNDTYRRRREDNTTSGNSAYDPWISSQYGSSYSSDSSDSYSSSSCDSGSSSSCD